MTTAAVIERGAGPNPAKRQPQSKTPKKPRRKVEEEIADRIIELLDRGDLPPWEQGWSRTGRHLPMNALSGRPYRGINRWMTLITQRIQGYDDPRWLTFKQAQSLGGHVREGEKSTMVVFWKIVNRKPAGEENPDEGEVFTREYDAGGGTGDKKSPTYSLLRAYSVFNVEQTEGCRLAELPVPELRDHTPLEAARRIVDGMPDPPEIQHYLHSDETPHYNVGRDRIRVPEPGRYANPDHYHDTLFHELVHSTGHEKRLNRPDLGGLADIHAYGREELVAGMGAAMLSAHAGLERENAARDAAYVRHWRDAIQGDKAMVVRAATLAQKAVDYILGEAPPVFDPTPLDPTQD